MNRIGRHLGWACIALAIGSCATAPVDDSTGNFDRLAERAGLGLSTSVPSDELVRSFELDFNVRVQGRRIDSSEGPAAEAGLRQGDVLLKLGENVLYSEDDLLDYLSVSSPGDQVAVLFKRESGTEPRRAVVTLGVELVGAEDQPALHWQFASLAQLPQALELARAQEKKVMVGLSGAET